MYLQRTERRPGELGLRLAWRHAGSRQTKDGSLRLLLPRQRLQRQWEPTQQFGERFHKDCIQILHINFLSHLSPTGSPDVCRAVYQRNRLREPTPREQKSHHQLLHSSGQGADGLQSRQRHAITRNQMSHERFCRHPTGFNHQNFTRFSSDFPQFHQVFQEQPICSSCC